MKQEQNKLSLLAAIFININIMIGAGLFINTTNLAQMVGAAGFVSYAILALLLSPLIGCTAALVAIYPSGGFYAYAKEIHPLVGFISAWSYFVGKLSSAVILTHSSMLLLQQIIPLMAQTNIFILDLVILSSFLCINLFGMKASSSIQTLFLTLKLIPILFVIGTGLYFISPEHYQTSEFIWPHFIDTIPFVLFAAIGFEATTSLSSNIKNPQRNGPLAIIISYLLVTMINVSYQFFFYGSVGEQLQQAAGFLQAFPLLLDKFLVLALPIKNMLLSILNIAIASSALGSAYGILFSNSWNLHMLARHNLLPYSTLFLKENRHQIPYWCIAAEGLICLIYLTITRGSQIPLQQISAFACTIAYTCSIISLFMYRFKNGNRAALLMPMSGIVNCLIFLAASMHSFATKGYFSLIIFASLVLFGLLIYAKQQKNENSSLAGRTL